LHILLDEKISPVCHLSVARVISLDLKNCAIDNSRFAVSDDFACNLLTRYAFNVNRAVEIFSWCLQNIFQIFLASCRSLPFLDFENLCQKMQFTFYLNFRGLCL
jgi:hypothetical protein